VVDGAVDRIDNPGETARALPRARLLAEEPVARPLGGEARPDEAFNLLVGSRDNVDKRRLAARNRHALTPALRRQLARLAREFSGEPEEFGVRLVEPCAGARHLIRPPHSVPRRNANVVASTGFEPVKA